MHHRIGTFKELTITAITVVAIYLLAAFETHELIYALGLSLNAQAQRLVIVLSYPLVEPELKICSDNIEESAQVSDFIKGPGQTLPRTFMFGTRLCLNQAGTLGDHFPIGPCKINKYGYADSTPLPDLKGAAPGGNGDERRPLWVFEITQSQCPSLYQVLPRFVVNGETRNTSGNPYLEIPAALTKSVTATKPETPCPPMPPLGVSGLKCITRDDLNAVLTQLVHKIYSYDVVDVPYLPERSSGSSANASVTEQAVRIPRSATLAFKEMHVLVTYVDMFAPILVLASLLGMYSAVAGLLRRLEQMDPGELTRLRAEGEFSWFPIDIKTARPWGPGAGANPRRTLCEFLAWSYTWHPLVVALVCAVLSGWMLCLSWRQELLIDGQWQGFWHWLFSDEGYLDEWSHVVRLTLHAVSLPLGILAGCGVGRIIGRLCRLLDEQIG